MAAAVRSGLGIKNELLGNIVNPLEWLCSGVLPVIVVVVAIFESDIVVDSSLVVSPRVRRKRWK